MKNRMTQRSERARARRVQRNLAQASGAPQRSAVDHRGGMARLTAETANALLTIDTIAEGTLTSRSIDRYRAYRQALLDSEQDIQHVLITLSLFVWDLFMRRSNTTLH